MVTENVPTAGDENALRLVVAGTVAETGTEFFRALVRNLAAVMGTTGAWVTEYDAENRRLRALAFWLNGAFLEHYEHAIEGTPCAVVVTGERLVHYPDRVLELYPEDPDLQALDAVSYLGVPLLDADGTVMGHLAVLDTKPLPLEPRRLSLFEIFAARAAAEQRRLRTEQEVRAREEQLSALLETALDAILVFDGQLQIVRVNQAATRLFGCTAEDLLGEDLREFLAPDSVGRIEQFTLESAEHDSDKRQLWLPQDFVARRWDHSLFPAEATLSCFESRRQRFLTLILRNLDERVQAERQLERLRQETEYLRDAVRELPGSDDLLGRSEGMQVVLRAIEQVARTDATVLITGETGTGKERVARALHRASHRAEQPLVLVNCAALPTHLIESELFGHERGAFTGAVARRDGRFALANGGTIFLDEIAELPLELQPKLLRVLQEGEFEPLGGTKTLRVNVRVIAATHRDLRQMVADGKFREDLFFRLHVFPIHLPPLRERGADVEQLAAAFVQRFARRLGKRVGPLTSAQLQCLRRHDWPGNVRELQNVIERALILSPGPDLQLERALAGVAALPEPAEPVSATPTDGTRRVLTAKEFEQLERTNLLRALQACQWRVAGEQGAARLLGLPPSTLSSRMKALQLRRPSS
ncbi:MAG: sigma 54-interacting transcriptional regulator [Verrucomicrobia bacterium]|nr:sigma 54-interacting transcriptional regulator [Verrucomicrobiota bacterium]